MALLANQALSNSVCVRFAADNCPGSIGEAVEVFSVFGDIARLDVSLCSVSGSVFATYFDIRSAQRVLAEFGSDAEVVAPAALDFRTVAVSTVVFKEVQTTFGGFETFGEVSKLAVVGDEQVVSFYDIRAAQQVLLNVPGARPQMEAYPLEPGDASTLEAEIGLDFDPDDATTSGSPAAALALAAAGWMPALPLPLHFGLGGASAAAGLGGALCDFGPCSPAWGLLAGCHNPPNSHAATMNGPAFGGKRGRTASHADTAGGFDTHCAGFGASFGPGFGQRSQTNGGGVDDGVVKNKTSGGAQFAANGGPAGVGKPVREKVNSRDLTKFDIVPEKVRNGTDRRTTVMVRNIPKTCSRDAFVEMLGKSQVADACSFIYMPFDKRRDMHCGFAFVNFKSAEDVLRLYESMQTPLWRTLGGGTATQPAMSYARLQGQDELMKHFSVSAVMHDNDASKRPVFFAKDVQHGPLILGQDVSNGHASPGHRQQPNQPRNRTGHAAKAPKQRQQVNSLGNSGWLCQYFGLDPLQTAEMPAGFPVWPGVDGFGFADDMAVSNPCLPRPPGLSGPESYGLGETLGMAMAAAATNAAESGYNRSIAPDVDAKVSTNTSMSTALDSEATLQSNAAGA